MLVERDAPLAELTTAVDAAGSGDSSIVVLTGSAGLGKTSLLEALRDEVGGQCDILWGGCDALFTPRPLGPVHDFPHAASTFRR